LRFSREELEQAHDHYLVRSETCASTGEWHPYGEQLLDPWKTIASSIHRQTRSDRLLGGSERMGPEHALGLFLGSADEPARRRMISVGAPADLCLPHLSLKDAMREPNSNAVRATFIGGDMVFGA
jgi:predicted amidohydrolase YtcJ